MRLSGSLRIQLHDPCQWAANNNSTCPDVEPSLIVTESIYSATYRLLIKVSTEEFAFTVLVVVFFFFFRSLCSPLSIWCCCYSFNKSPGCSLVPEFVHMDVPAHDAQRIGRPQTRRRWTAVCKAYRKRLAWTRSVSCKSNQSNQNVYRNPSNAKKKHFLFLSNLTSTGLKDIPQGNFSRLSTL